MLQASITHSGVTILKIAVLKQINALGHFIGFCLLVTAGFSYSDAAADTNEHYINELIAGLTNQQKAAQIIMVYYAGNDFIAKHQFGSVLVMQNMLKKPKSFRSRLKKLNAKLPLGVIAAIDQEGGLVNRLKKLPEWKSAPSAKTMRDWAVEDITSLTQKMAIDLNHLGIRMNLAPVLDPSLDHAANATFMEKSQRSFGVDIDQILPSARAFIEGFQKEHILTISKHFPGYNVKSNSDHEIAMSDAPFESIINNTISFAALSRDVDGIMMSSILFAEIIDRPAVLSPFMVSWAQRLHPGKPVITDDLWGVALRSWVSPEHKYSKHYPDAAFLKLVRMALTSGNDILMITYPVKAVLMKNAIAQWIQDDAFIEQHVNESVRKIIRLKMKLDLLDKTSDRGLSDLNK